MYTCDVKRMEDKIKNIQPVWCYRKGRYYQIFIISGGTDGAGRIQERMEAIGATIEVDDLANMYATIPARSQRQENRYGFSRRLG